MSKVTNQSYPFVFKVV